MADHQKQGEMILTACSTGDVPKLNTLFQELGIGPDQPKNEWDFDKSIAPEHSTPSVNSMLYAAVQGEQMDLLGFLLSKFPNSSLNGSPIRAAIDKGNIELLEVICKLDPAAANGEIDHANVLAYACSTPGAAGIVKVLLESGADPNKEAQHTPPFSNISYAVSGGLPVSTMEQFFDAGYEFNDRWAVRWAVRYNRSDVLEALFGRGKDLPTAWYPPREELIQLAEENKNTGMVTLIKSIYPDSSKQKGPLATLVGRLHSKLSTHAIQERR